MRRFELILAGCCAGAIAWPALFGSRPRRGLVFLGTLGATVAQLVIEGFRWQMIPLYMVAIGLGLGDLLSLERNFPWWRRLSRPALGLIGLGMMTLLPAVLPVPVLPTPSGPLEVGTVSLPLTFPDRLEQYGAEPDLHSRRIMVQVWYPADVPDGAISGPWSDDVDVVGPALSRRLGFPGFFLSHTRYTSDHSVASAPPLSGRFPVVIYSHGWTGFRTIAVNQAESLASHGYVVVAPDHTFAAISTRFPDGTVVDLDPQALPPRESVEEEVYDQAGTDLVATLTDDLVGILNALEAGEAGAFGEIASHTDLGLVGVFGHSSGGGAAVQLCLIDLRCKAVLGMDAWVEPVPDRVIATPATRPMLFIRSDGWRGTPNDGRLRGMAERSENRTYWIGIDGASHNDFVLAPLFSPIAARLGLKGPIPAGRIIPIIDRFLVGFFDHTLLGTGAAAIEQNPFDEVTLEVIGQWSEAS
ncbi:MAG: alpha/beta hydrolase family protein [Acidimicrobiia bacterium]